MARLAAASALLLAVALICAYAGLRDGGPTLDRCLADPARFDGATVRSPREAVVGEVKNGWFMLRWGGREIPVKGTSPHLKSGAYVAVRGVFRREGYLEASALHVGRYRRLKMAVSVVAAAVVFAMLRRRFRWDRGERAFRER